MNLLTEREQVEILEYISWKARDGRKPDFEKYPAWIVGIESEISGLRLAVFAVGFFALGVGVVVGYLYGLLLG